MNRPLLALALILATTTAHAASFPVKSITMIVPFPPGGSSDMVARIMGPKVNERLGQSVVIDNRAGATGAIGATMVKRAPADGHTILVASIGVYAINPFLQKGLQYDPAKDFDLLTVAVRAPNVLVMNPAMPAKNVQEFVGYLKKMPARVTFASSGRGLVGSSDGRIVLAAHRHQRSARPLQGRRAGDHRSARRTRRCVVPEH